MIVTDLACNNFFPFLRYRLPQESRREAQYAAEARTAARVHSEKEGVVLIPLVTYYAPPGPYPLYPKEGVQRHP